MRGARGFTIIEFTIAIAVAAIIGSAAVSRYNSFLRYQDFISGGQQIANCLSRANAQARVGAATTTPRFVRATINYTNNTSTVTCVTEQFPQFTSSGVAITTTDLLGYVYPESGADQTFSSQNTQMTVFPAAATDVHVVFGTMEEGVPIGLSTGGTLIRQPDNGLLSSFVPLGRGFSINTSTDTIKLSSTVTGDCGVIVMTNLGTPVRFETSSC